MRILHDPEICSFHGECVDIAPEVFGWAEDESLKVLQSEPPEAEHERVRRACRECPTQAIRLEA